MVWGSTGPSLWFNSPLYMPLFPALRGNLWPGLRQVVLSLFNKDAERQRGRLLVQGHAGIKCWIWDSHWPAYLWESPLSSPSWWGGLWFAPQCLSCLLTSPPCSSQPHPPGAKARPDSDSTLELTRCLRAADGLRGDWSGTGGLGTRLEKFCIPQT